MKNMKLARIITLSFLLLSLQILSPANSFISKAQRQSMPPGLEGTKWQAIQSNETYSPILERLLSREFFCSFEKRGEISCSVIVTAASKIKDEQYYDPIEKRVKYRKVLIPRSTFREDRVGTYKQKGDSVQIELSAYKIEAKVHGNRMAGDLTLKLESNQKTRWVARRITGQSNN